MKLIINLLVLVAMTLTSFAGQYQLTILGDGVRESAAYDVNKFGFACGYQVRSSRVEPTMWEPSRSVWSLFPPSESTSNDGVAYTISDVFEIGGGFGTFSASDAFKVSAGTATVWVFDQDIEDFMPYNILGGAGIIRDIDSLGNFAGDRDDFGVTGFIYDQSLFTSSVRGSTFYGVSQGNAVGTQQISGGMPFAFGGSFAEKKSNGTYETTTTVEALGIGHGRVTKALKSNTNSHVAVIREGVGGFYWERRTGSNVFLGSETLCYDINNFDTLVGSTNGRACKWEKVGNSFKCTDLNTLVVGVTNFIMETAYGVNDKGHIVGQGVDTQTGVRSAFLLFPTRNVPIHIEIASNGSIDVSWSAEKDSVYSVQTSDDLKTWTEKEIRYSDAPEKIVFRRDPKESPCRFTKVVNLTP